MHQLLRQIIRRTLILLSSCNAQTQRIDSRDTVSIPKGTPKIVRDTSLGGLHRIHAGAQDRAGGVRKPWSVAL